MTETQRFLSAPISAETLLTGVQLMESKKDDEVMEGWEAVKFLDDALTFLEQCLCRDLLQVDGDESMGIIVHFDALFLKYGRDLPQHWPGKETWKTVRKKLTAGISVE